MRDAQLVVGGLVVVFSSDGANVIVQPICDRLLVMSEGRITAEFSPDRWTSAKLTYVGLGGFGIEISSTELIDDRVARD